MSQPVVDTLQLSDALRNTGMEREQAEGVARALGKELGAHVVAQGDVESGFERVRSDLGQKIQAVDAKVDVLRAELTSKIDAINWKLTFMFAGFGLLLSVLTVVSGMGLFERTPVGPYPVSEAAFPSPPVAPHAPQAPLASGAD